jgi:acyl-CoA synthetase (AMP-forming)/AMP-acid ligase II
MTPPPLNVAGYLELMATEHPTRVALQIPSQPVQPEGDTPHRAITFAELNRFVDALAHGLAELGITRGVRTVLMVPPSVEFFALTFAHFKLAAVPVLIDPGMGIRNLGQCLNEAEPQAFIGIPKAHIARRVLGWAKRTLRTTICVGRWRLGCQATLAQVQERGRHHGRFPIPTVARDDVAAILFTSGSTGVAKGAVYCHGNFAAQVQSLKQTYGILPGEVDLCTFPLFALFGPALGMTCVIPDMDPTRPAQLDPHKALAQIRQFKVTNLFGSPAVIRRMATLVDRQRATTSRPEPATADPAQATLPTLKRVISAGAPASIPAIERFVQLLPKSVQVFTPYGATEALPVSNIGSQEILSVTRCQTEQGRGVCVGRPVPGIQVHVIPISDAPVPIWDDSLELPVGEIGELVVRGAVVTHKYFNRPEATQLAKIVDPRSGEILHRMGDVGYRDDQGRLWFCGRKSHRVETSNGTIFTDMVEPIFHDIPGVVRTALVGLKRLGRTIPVICVEWDRSRPWIAVEMDLREQARRFAHTRGITTFLAYRGTFPVDVRHNSKIFREKLALWADRKLGPRLQPDALAVGQADKERIR